MKTNCLKVMARWWWVWLIHGFFVAVMCQFFFFKNKDWHIDSYPALGLSVEMNYAVWWSGICLFLASLIYFCIAALDKNSRSTWNILGLMALALCLDEIGSLHETVAQIAGWPGLLPFAVILGTGFVWSILQLSKTRSTRLPGMFISLGVAIFVGVAGLEFIEHNVEATPVEQRLRLIIEEGSELVGIGLLITAGLIAYLQNPACTSDSGDISLSSISRVLAVGFDFPIGLFTLFAFNLSVISLFVIPNHSWFPFRNGEGNIAVLFPALLFTCLGLYCFHRSLKGGRGWFLVGTIMIITSLLQMYNLNQLVQSALQKNYELLMHPPDTWLVTLVPWLVIVIFTRKQCPTPWRTIVGHFAVLFTVLIFLIPDIENRVLVDCYYFLLSSCIGYSCFYFLLMEYRYSRVFRKPIDS